PTHPHLLSLPTRRSSDLRHPGAIENMSAAPPRITCLYFSDLTIAAFLKTSVGATLAGDILVECSSRPALSWVCHVELPATYRGVDRKSTRLNSSHRTISY